jgi:hypothetical protein
MTKVIVWTGGARQTKTLASTINVRIVNNIIGSTNSLAYCSKVELKLKRRL